MSLRKIGDYAITRELGRGGMGKVYQALSPEGGTVAVKTVLWPDAGDPRARWEATERFQREARAARSLEHPNICQVLDFGAEEDSLYIVMEFLDGETVLDLIALAGGIRTARALEIVSDVGEALDHAHQQGIIHRDIKPANIMVLRTGRVKLTDFGLASIVRETTLTQTGSTLGTLYYMSPEQIRGEKLDARSDIFSLGATFYEMLAGARPFQADEPAAVMNRILTTDPLPIPGLPPGLSQFLQRCLQKDPSDRFQTARAMLDALAAAGAHDPAALTAVQPHLPAAAAAASSLAPSDALPPRTPPPPLDTPEAEEADVRRRANFHFPEDFEGGLDWFVVGPSGSGITTRQPDALVLSGHPAQIPGSHYPHWSDFRGAIGPCEFVMEATINKLDGPDDMAFGLGFHALPVDAYTFDLFGNGNIRVLKYFRGHLSELALVERSPHVNRGNTHNLLRAVRRHGRLHIFVNDHHALTADDFDLGIMTLCLGVWSGVQASFSNIHIHGIDGRNLLFDVHSHMHQLDTAQALQKLDYMKLYLPQYVAPDIERALLSPDRQTTVLITLPPGARLARGGDAPAKRLVDTINASGAGRPFHWATDITETEIGSDQAPLDCPLIAIGHPDRSPLTSRLRSELPRDRLTSTPRILIYHDIDNADRRVALWGHNPASDLDAVNLFISSGLLDRFLAMVWQTT